MEKTKKSTGKKIIKWVLGIVLVLIIALVSIPFLFKDKIVQMVSNTINNSVNASVTFKDVEVSLFTNFPLASVQVSEIAVVNKAPFLGDTLFATETLSISMKITELFKGANEAIQLNSFAVKNGQVNIVFNQEGFGNYDIAIANENEVVKDTVSSPFSFDIQEYEVENINFSFVDESSNLKMQLNNINHSGTGNFAEDVLDLDTKTTANVFLDFDNTNYIENVTISLNAVLGIDLKNSKYTFKENTGYINQLPLQFNGFVQLVDENQLYDLTFKTPNSSFKNALGLLPKQYAGNLSAIKTAGNFDLKGVVKGVLSTDKIPTFDISFVSENAMFKYDDLPKAVRNIHINTTIINKTGNLNDTYVNVDKLAFKIDEDAFSANGNVANVTTNPKVNLAAKGTVNLANISQAYPVKLETALAGILKADVSTSFDMNSVEKGNYQNIQNKGVISVNDFKYEGDDVANPFYINKTEISFNTNTIKLNEFDAKTGTSDISINGNLDNFYGFLFNKEVLKGNFALKSDRLKIADFLSDVKTTETETPTSTLKIPAFLDCKFTANAKQVIYDNINLDNVSGTLFIKDETVRLENLKSDIFDGKIAFSGLISTKNERPSFDVDLNLDAIDITKSFSSLEMLSSIAPIAKIIQGKLNSKIKVAGILKDDMTPDLMTITGDLFGQLLNTKVDAKESKMLSLLGDKVSFFDPSKLNLDKLTAVLGFENGVVNVKPFNLNYNDIGIQIQGNHSFNKTMDYDIMFDVPAKYLGSEITGVLSKLTPKDAAEIKNVPIKATLSGQFTSPKLTTNIQDATTSLVKNLVEKQKQSLINQGKDKLTGLLGFGTKTTDSTKTAPKEITKDSIKKTVEDKAKDKIKGTLKDLFGRKKDTTKKN